MKPWVGKDFKDQEIRVLILGESWYGDFQQKDEIRYIETWIRRESPGKTDRFFSRIYNACNSKSAAQSTELERSVFWHKVAFTNLVSESVGNKARIRPNDAHWKRGVRRLELLLKKLKCNRVLVLGLEAGFYAETVLKKVEITFVKCPHPSGYGVTTECLREKWRELQ
jgi:hypothetical protein